MNLGIQFYVICSILLLSLLFSGGYSLDDFDIQTLHWQYPSLMLSSWSECMNKFIIVSDKSKFIYGIDLNCPCW